MSDPSKAQSRGRGQKSGRVPPPGQQPQATAAGPAPSTQRVRARAAPSTQAGRPEVGRPEGVVQMTKKMADVSLEPSGSAEGSRGRGQMRGRRVLEEAGDVQFIVTKPANLNSKKASTCNAKLQPVQFVVNYFKVNKQPKWSLNLYRVDFNPPEDMIRVQKGLLYAHKDKLGAYIFDGTVLYTPNTIMNGAMTLTSVKNDEEKTVVEIKIKHVKVLQHGDIAYIHLFNLIMRRVLRELQLQLVGRNYFDQKAKEMLQAHKIEVWPGYDTVMRQHETDILLCVEITHKIMRLQTVLDIYEECRRDPRFFQQRIVKQIVMTNYNNQTYRIDDVDFDATPLSTFDFKGTKVSYVQYYQQKHNIRIRNTNQPMLVSKSKPRDLRAGRSELVYLVPELCITTGLDDNMRNDFRLMKALGDITRVAPRERLNKLERFRQRLEENRVISQEIFKEWDLALDKQLVRVNGHVLPPEQILFAPASKKKVDAGMNAEWSRSFRDSPLFACVDLEHWCVFTTNQDRQSTMAFVDMMQRAASGMRFRIGRPQEFILTDDRVQNYTAGLDRALSRNQYALVMCVVSNNKADRYSAIKKKCSIDRSVPSQVIVRRTLNSKGAMSVATKVAIQINCKLGGAPWAVEIPLKGTMIIGFDVTHDTNSRESSFGAMVASLDDHFCRYFSAVSPHSSGNELSNNVGYKVNQAIEKYKQINGCYPKSVVFYRDGVGEGQINFVVDSELNTIKKVIGGLETPENKIALTFVIVNKRINTRIMLPQGNPAPGSVIDDVITSPERYDFFLVSQSVQQGTVSPTYYNVIHDTNRMLNPDRLQRLSYKLCHLYYNWSGTVRVPAPCQYAHRLAFLCGQSLHRAPSYELNTLLHFL